MSIKVDVEVKGINRAINNLGMWQLRKKGGAQRVLDETALNVERKAKKLVPVDTGRLQSSIAVRSPTVLTREVGAGIASNVEYAAYVEYGTGRRGEASRHTYNLTQAQEVEYGSRAGQAAQPYMTPAWLSEKPKFVAKMVEVLNE